MLLLLLVVGRCGEDMAKIVLPLLEEADDVEWVVDVLVAMEFCLDVTVAENSELWRQMLSVSSEDLTVELEWGNETSLGCHCSVYAVVLRLFLFECVGLV